MEKTLNFEFNTAIGAVREEDGKFIDQDFSALAMPLRGQLMQLDGLTGCAIVRYGLKVSYNSNVTTEEVVIKHVEKCIAWAAAQSKEDGIGNPTESQKYFPHRGDKTPTATCTNRAEDLAREREKTTPYKWVTFTFDTYLMPFGTANAGYCRDLIRELTMLDGVVNFELSETKMGLLIDPAYCSPEQTVAHLEQVLVRLKGNGIERNTSEENRNYFPFWDRSTPLGMNIAITGSNQLKSS